MVPGGFWNANMPAVNFAYALAFFTLGIGITLQGRLRETRFSLARALPALAGFATVHALADWGGVFIPLYATLVGEPVTGILSGVKTVATAVSFGFLLEFGVLLLVLDRPLERWVRPGPAVLTVFWVALFLAYPVLRPETDLHDWFGAGEVWARYLLGFPAATLAAGGLAFHRAEIGRCGRGQWLPHLRGASLSFAVYAIAAGLIVPRQPFFPASVLNEDWFLSFFGFPVRLLRGAAGLGVTVFMLRLLDIFKWEVEVRLRRMEEERAILCERERIARDLHDGIMQTLYGAGLGLRQVGTLLDELGSEGNPGEHWYDRTALDRVRSLVTDMSDALSRAVTELRTYVQSLCSAEQSVSTCSELIQAVGGLIRQVVALTGLRIDLKFDSLDAGPSVRVEDDLLPRGLRDDAIALVREALSNVVRHSGSRRARVLLARSDGTLLVRVADEGRGFDPAASAEGYGLRNMRRRTEARGGVLQVISTPGQGTQVVAYLPLGDSEARQDAQHTGGAHRGSEARAVSS